MSRLQFAERVHGITGASAFFFQLIDAKGGVAGNGQAEHLDALLETAERLFEFVGRPKGRDEPDLVERALFPALLGQDQMALVNGIEGAAEDAHTHDGLAHVAAVAYADQSSKTGQFSLVRFETGGCVFGKNNSSPVRQT